MENYRVILYIKDDVSLVVSFKRLFCLYVLCISIFSYMMLLNSAVSPLDGSVYYTIIEKTGDLLFFHILLAASDCIHVNATFLQQCQTFLIRHVIMKLGSSQNFIVLISFQKLTETSLKPAIQGRDRGNDQTLSVN